MAEAILKRIPGGVCAPCGFLAAGVRAGLKRRGRDLALIYSQVPAAAAGIFTSNKVAAAPVLISRERVSSGSAQAILANAGNANACTGRQGALDAATIGRLASDSLGIAPESVLLASTGIIGRPLPMARFEQGIPPLVAALSITGHQQAAEAILTTDTRPKEVAVEFDHNGVAVRIGAMAKGAGMIAPDLATMLCFITTDATIAPSLLTACLQRAAMTSFNCISVDGDTSTNDTVLALANGQAEAMTIMPGRGLRQFQHALDFVCQEMARGIVADAEGATKFIEIVVTGAASARDARQVGLTIAGSPLVKTALFGQDPNWGRVLAAAGRARAKIVPDLIALSLGGIEVVSEGTAAKYDEAKAKRAIDGRQVKLELDLGIGRGAATVWTSDLTYDYIRINAEYHT